MKTYQGELMLALEDALEEDHGLILKIWSSSKASGKFRRGKCDLHGDAWTYSLSNSTLYLTKNVFL